MSDEDGGLLSSKVSIGLPSQLKAGEDSRTHGLKLRISNERR